MKKLMTVLFAATATLFASGAFADFTTSGTSFEDLTVGNTLDTTRDDDGVNTNARYWYSTETTQDGLVVSNYDAASASTPIANRPDYFKDDSNGQYLKVETSAPLYRSAEINSQDGTFSQVTIPDGGLYFDTLIQFTPADNVFGADALDISAGDKIAIEYVEREEERDAQDESIITVTALTNFVIRAGYIDDPTLITPTNYLVAVPSTFSADKTGWHRLTIRTIADINGSGNVGFVVYLDGEALEYADLAQEAGAGFTPVGAAVNFYDSSKKSLFPSAVSLLGTNPGTIAAAIFNGTGALDDVVFTADKPAFISEGIPVTFTGVLGVSSITVSVGGGSPESVDLTDPTIVLPAGTTTFTMNVTADTAHGYTYTGYMIGSDIYSSSDTTVTVGGAVSMTIDILATRNNFSYVDSNDDLQECSSLVDAFADAKSGTTITLLNAYAVADWEDMDYFEYFEIDKTVTLDLNGWTLDGGESLSNPLFYVAPTGEFTIIDSAGGGTIIYDGPCVVYNDWGGAAIIGAVSGDYGPTVTGVLFTVDYEGSIVRGKFDTLNNTDDSGAEDAFLWEAFVDPGSESSGPTAGYWVVTPKGGATTYELSLTLPDHATATYAVDGGGSVSYSSAVQIDAGSAVVITATPDSGYTYAGVSLGAGWSLSGDAAVYTIASMDAAAALTVPAPEEAVVTYELSVTVPEHTTATYAVNGGAAVAYSTPVELGAGTNVTVTVTPDSGYTYTGVELAAGWTLTDGSITASVTMTSDWGLTPDAPAKESEYPTYVDSSDAMITSQYTEWVGRYGTADTASAYEAAFLLNVAPDAADQDLDPIAMVVSGTSVVITMDHGHVNGYPYIQTATTPAGVSSAAKTPVTIGETGRISLTVSGDARFYRVGISPTALTP